MRTPQPGGSNRGDSLARRLWQLWSLGQQPKLEDFLAAAGGCDPERLVAVLRVDQRERSRLGQWIPAEAYLETYPALQGSPEHAVDLVFAEYLLREERGEQPAVAEYVERFPQYALELELQIELHEALGADRDVPPTWADTSLAGRGAHRDEAGPEPAAFPDIPGYEIVDILGWGGMGVVYRAVQAGLNRAVAVKMVHAGAHASPQVLARFRVEAEAVGRLQHPNIVQIHEVGEHAGFPYLVLELVEGPSLAQWLGGTPRPARHAAELVQTLARAIHFAHRLGVVHRDLTPSNVLLSAELAPKITDFGLAKLVMGGGELRTQAGELLGTPSYMAPEQAASQPQTVGVGTDVYALGAILYEVLTGRPPFKAESPLETLRQVLADEPVAPARLQPRLPRDLETICLKCLRKDPARRYASALELAEDLRHYLEGRAIAARRSGTLERAWRWCVRNRVVAALLVCVAGLLTSIAVVASVLAARMADQRDQANWNARRAQSSQRGALARLGASYLAQAQAERYSGRVGQRFDSLEAIDKAKRIARSLNLPPARIAELRNEAIACLALPDVKLVRQWDALPAGTMTVAIDDRFGRYVRGNRDGDISLRTIADDHELLHLEKAGYRPIISPDGAYLAADGPEPALKVWHIESGALLLTYQGRHAWTFCPTRTRLALGRNDGSIELFDLGTRSILRSWACPSMPRLLTFSADGALLAVILGSPEAIEIFQVDFGASVAAFPAPKASKIAWHPDSRTVAVADDDRKISFWDLPSGRRKLTLEGPRTGGVQIEFSRDGNLFGCWGWDGKLRLWDPGSGRLLMHFPGRFPSPVFGADRRMYMARHNDEQMGLWQVACGREFRSLARADYHASNGDLAIHPGGRLLALGMEDGVGLWDLATGGELGLLPIGTTRHLLFDPAGDLITRGGYGVLRWPVQVEISSRTLRIGPSRSLPLSGNVVQIDQSRDGRVFGLAQFDGAMVYDVSRPGQTLRLGPHADVRYVAVSPDGRWVATGSHSAPAVKVWDAREGRLIAELPSEGWTELYFSRDGRWLSVGHDHCRVYAVGSWSPAAEVGGTGLGFSPDGRLLAVESGSGVVRLVDPASGRDYARLEHPSQERASRVAFTPDGLVMATTSADSSAVHVWNLGAIGRELDRLGLPWELPAGAGHEDPPVLAPLRLEIVP
jgi:WD40 repeat protein